MLKNKDLRGFYMLEMAMVYFMELVLIIFSARIIMLGRTVFGRMLLMLFLYVGLAGIAVIIFYCGKGKDGVLGFSRKKIGKQILIGVSVAAFTLCITAVFPLLIGVNSNIILSFKSSSVTVLIFYVLYYILFVGFAEEMIFRGYFYNRIKDVTGIPWMPMLISALLFGILHYPGTQNIISVGITFVLGLLYGYCRWRIKDCSLLSVSLAHGLQNAGILVLSYFLL